MGLNMMLTLLLLLLISSTGVAQRTLNGLVISKKDGQSIPGAVVLLTKTGDSVILRTTITDNDGKFIMSTDPDVTTYQLKVSSIGFDTQVIPLNNSLTTLSITLLESAALTLKTVQIAAKRPVIERKIDRTVLNVENSIALIGGDALEAMSKAPGVRVGSDNSISLIGKSGVRIMVNDRLVTLSGEDLVNLLKSIPSDNLSRVEVITNPPAKYDAAGNAGLINIVTKRNPMKGFTGNGRLGYVKTKFPAENAGLNLGYNSEKWSTTAIVNAGYGHVFSTNGKETFYPNQLWSEEAGNKNTNKNFSGSFGLEFKPNAKQLFAFKFDRSYADQSRESSSTTTIRKHFANQVDSKKMFTKTRGIIVDLREYPNDFMPYTFVNYIKSGKNLFVKISLVDYSNPGTFLFIDSASNGSQKKDECYNGKVIVIVNSDTQSQGEFTTMAFQSSPNVSVIGSQTAGADGEVSTIVLPGGISTGISSRGIFYPDNSPTQGVGVKIDNIVKPTIKGVIDRKDELLEKAINILTKS